MKRNPLAIAFGSALRDLREENAIPISEISSAIGINESYYRVIESGATTVHISKAIDIYSGFKSFDVDIDYEGVRDILLGIGHVNNYFVNSEDDYTINQPKKNLLFERLIILEKRLYLLLKKLDDSNVFEFLNKSHQEIIELFLSTRFKFFVSDFLSNYENVGGSVEEIENNFVNEFFEDVPTYYFEYLNSIKEQLLDMPISINLSDMREWEKRKSGNFKKLEILIKDHNYITSIKNLTHYKYTYLMNEHFEEMNVVYLNRDIDKIQVEKIFKENVIKVMETNPDNKIEVEKIIMNKVRFFQIPENQQHLAINGLTLNNETYNVSWIFTLKNNVKVAFIATIDNSGERQEYTQGLSLKYQKTIEQIGLIRKMTTCEG